MKANVRSFQMFIRQIRSDSMLYLFCILPLVIAAVFRFGIPYLEATLCSVFDTPSVLSEYYLLFDMFLAIFSPYFLLFISSMVMLTEIDENVAAYLAVTPIRKKGYIISRLLYPALISMLISIVLLHFFTLTSWTIVNILLVCMLSVFISLPIAMLVVVFSNNRVEGMALAKLSGLILFGLPVPFIIPNGFQYLFSWLPSFWMAKVFTGMNYWAVIPAILVSIVWIWVQYKRFENKLL